MEKTNIQTYMNQVEGIGKQNILYYCMYIVVILYKVQSKILNYYITCEL